MRRALLLLAALAARPGARAQTNGWAVPVSTSAGIPTYLSLAPNIHDFTRFADGGPDANWYVGFNNAWIVKLPPAPAGDFTRAFIGAKLGRAKTRPHPNKPWVRERLDGKVYAGISQTPSFSSEQSFFLAETADLSLEADPSTNVDGVGGGDWFWAEVPPARVSFTKPNYLVVWSPTKYFQSASSSPILGAAAVEGSSEPRAWNNRSILGVPPRSPAGALETPLNNIGPAIAIKLVPPNELEVSISDFSLERYGRKAVARFSVGGENVIEAWVETSRDQLDWERLTPPRRRPPYAFTLGPDRLPGPGRFLRGAARDEYGNVGNGDPFQIPYAYGAP